jgi:hypothetical protein
MDYWENPQHDFNVGQHTDIFASHLLSGQKVIYVPEFPLNMITRSHTVDDVCNFVNNIDLYNDPYWCPNMVKIDIWAESMRRYGIIKPVLLSYDDDHAYQCLTGSTRVLCADLISSIDHVPAFISLHNKNSDSVIKGKQMFDFDRFITYANAQPGDSFSVKFTNNPEDFGLYWFEYSHHNLAAAVPDDEWCTKTMQQYIKDNPGLVIDREWLAQPKFFYQP